MAIFYASQSNFLFYGACSFISLCPFTPKGWYFYIFLLLYSFFYLKWLSSECRLTNETEYRYTQGVLKEVGIQTEMQYKIFLLWKLKLTSYINILLVFTFQNVRKNERLWKMAKLSFSNCHHYSTWIFLLLSVRAQVLTARGGKLDSKY